MIKLTLSIEFITYDGSPGSRPPLFDPTEGLEMSGLDGHHQELMVIPVGHYKPLSMAFMLFYCGPPNNFEWCSKYSAANLFDEGWNVTFPLQIGDSWAIWPMPTMN